MRNVKLYAAACATAVVLSACGSSTETPLDIPTQNSIGSVVENTDGTYTVTTVDETLLLPTGNLAFNGNPVWAAELSGGFDAAAYSDSNVVAVGGFFEDEAFAAITGTTTTPPTGDTSYQSRYFLQTADISSFAQILLTYDFDANTLTGEDDGFVVDGVTSGGDFTGTVTHEDLTADLEGGFYGEGVVGAFSGTGIGGIFYGPAP